MTCTELYSLPIITDHGALEFSSLICTPLPLFRLCPLRWLAQYLLMVWMDTLFREILGNLGRYLTRTSGSADHEERQSIANNKLIFRPPPVLDDGAIVIKTSEMDIGQQKIQGQVGCERFSEKFMRITII